jgi:hypothetical protein
MSMMSVYQRAQPVRQVDHLDCIGASGTREDTHLLRLALRENHPVLIGLDGQHSIAKPVEEGDESLTFETLFDTCYTIADLQRMQQAGVDTPKDIPPQTYRVELGVPISFIAAIDLAISSKNMGETRPTLRKLINEDLILREELVSQLLTTMTHWLVENMGGMDVVIRSTTLTDLDPPLDIEGGHTWRILQD